MVESDSLTTGKYYANFIPTYSAQAIHKAVTHLYCCEDIVIKGKLGDGYFASVFLVHHRPSDQLMALKLTNGTSIQRREVELLSSLNHSNVLRLYGSCVIGARFVCLTEYVNGGSLAQLITAPSIDLPWLVRIKLALDILNGLHHLHSHNLIHRDLTSPNILIRVSTIQSHLSTPTNNSAFLSISSSPSSSSSSLSSRSQSDLFTTQNCSNLKSDHNRIHKNLDLDSELCFKAGDSYVNGFSSLLLNHHQTKQSNQTTQSTESSSLLPDTNLVNTDCIDSLNRNFSSVSEFDENGINLADLLLSSSHLDENLVCWTKSQIPLNLLRSIPVIEPQWKQSLLNIPHQSLKSSVYRDTPISNLMYTAVVADLGLCLDLSQENVDAVSLVGNPYYTSPECLNRVAPYTFAADVFSFGLLTCELITRLQNDGLLIPRVSSFGLDSQKLPVPQDCPDWFRQLAIDCCVVDHLVRPKISDLLDRINKNLVLDKRLNSSSTTLSSKSKSNDLCSHSLNCLASIVPTS